MNRLVKVFFNPAFIAFIFLSLLSPNILAQQKTDKEYSRKILEYTTEKFFLTELVDYLPASEKVPTPKKILGNIIGAPDILHYTADIKKYMKAVAEASPRVLAFSIGKSDEGKEMITVAVSDEKNIARLKQIKEILNLLSDPRKIKESEAEKLLAAERSFSAEDKKFNAGTFIIPTSENLPELLKLLKKTTQELGLTAYGTASMPKVKTHPLTLPRIAILHTWIFTQNEGWFRLAFEKLEIPYSYISVHDIRDTEDLKSKYDVIIFPPVMFGKAQRLVNGIGSDSPIPWKKSEKYLNLGGPDSRDDTRGGMGLKGILHLYRFIEKGGLFIPITSNASLPIDYGFVESVSVVKPEKLKTAGAVLQARIIDHRSPISYGYDRTLGVHFNGAPVLETGMKAVMGGLDLETLFYGESKGRASGRGTLKDPDVIPGRPYKPPKIKSAGTGIPPEFRDMLKLYMPSDLTKIRVILRFDQKEKLLQSGMLAGGEELQNRAAVVDVPLGKGHVLFFAINPMWRFETHGSFFLLFNAALNYDNLDVGLPKALSKKDNNK